MPMKKLMAVMLAGLLLAASVVNADPDRWVAGAILGTAAGLVIAHNVHGVNPWVAAPAGAVLGGYLGSQGDRHGRPYWGYYGYRQPNYYSRYNNWYGYPYGFSDPYAHPQTRIVYVREQEKAKPLPVQPIADPHPGVDLIKISILNSNGIRTDVPLLRVKGRFVGPQGEDYETLPTTDMLTKRYGM
jgi:hypothetical protein